MSGLTRFLNISAFSLLAFTVFAIQPGMLHAKQKGDLIIRLRSATLTSDTHGTTTSGGSARVGSDTVPELDFTYFFNDNIASELILATTKTASMLLVLPILVRFPCCRRY